MRQDIIEQMKAELNDTQFCKSDFEHDLKALQNYDEPFLWMVRKNGTDLQCIGISFMLKWEKCEHSRFQLYRDMNCVISGITYCSDSDAKYFFYDAIMLVKIKKEQIPELWRILYEPVYKEMITKYSAEYAIKDLPLEIRFASEITKARVGNMLRFAKTLKDESLCKCLRRLKGHQRIAVDQYIKIYSDFAYNSFGWSEMVNGECRINGGIIYHSDKDNDRWQIHT